MKISKVRIIKSGFYSTIQDGGRYGYEHLGVPVSGAMDMFSYRWGNQLLNNLDSSASIEFTLVGPIVQFLQDSHFVLTGGNAQAILDDTIIEGGKVLFARANQILNIKAIKRGTRGYLSVAGGFDSECVLGSRSMYKGITSHATLENEALINIGTSNYGVDKGASIHRETLSLDKTIIAYPGPEFEFLTPQIQELLKQRLFTISPKWNRMSITLQETIKHNLPSVLTGPVVPGTVQLTPEGKLIILMRDAQVTGGYPRVIQVNEKGINLLAQKKQGDSLQLHLDCTAMI